MSHEYIEKCLQRLSYLQVKIRDVNWAEFSGYAFAKNARNAITDLEAIEKLLLEIKKNEIDLKAADFEGILKDYNKTISLLKKNAEFEEKKAQENVQELEDHNPELFASVQHKVISLILRTRFFIERLSLQVGKKDAMQVEDKEGRNELMELLKHKERELQELREKHEEIKKSVFFGLHEENAADIEDDLSKIRLALEKEKNALEESFSNYKSKISGLQAEFLELADRLEEVEKNFDYFCDKSSELTLLLKKERDFAKKMVLDIEAEVLALRNTYSQELLSLEEKKLDVKRKTEKEVSDRIRALEDEIIAKEELLKHFRDLAKSKEKETHALEEKMAYLNAAMQSKEKNAKSKRPVRGKRKQSKRK